MNFIPSHSCADAIVRYIQQCHVTHVFGVPGGAIEPLFDALARGERNKSLRLVVARHECGAAFMADGYYRETGKMGVVCSTTGPGATNLITGVASAKADEIPILVITAQTSLNKFGRPALQESSCSGIDTVAMFKHCTKQSTLVSHVSQLKHKLICAITAAHDYPKGPVHLSIPMDILSSPIDFAVCPPLQYLEQQVSLADEKMIMKLSKMIAVAENVVVYIGYGAGEAGKVIAAFCELVNAKFVCDMSSKGFTNETHSLYRGVYGFSGHKSAVDLLNDHSVDIILAVGARFGEFETNNWTSDLLNSKLVHIDEVPTHFRQSYVAKLHVHGNIKRIFEQLIARFYITVNSTKEKNKAYSLKPDQLVKSDSCVQIEEHSKCRANTSPVKPQRLMAHLTDCLPKETRVFVDAGNSWAWATHYLASESNCGLYRVGLGFAAMGWAIAAAVGSSIANPLAPTICITGDGAYLMSAQEITVAQQYNCPIIFIVLNDTALGMVKHGQKLAGAESIGWQLCKVNYAEMASSMGINSILVTDSMQLDHLDYQDLFSLQGPTLIDVQIDPEEVPLMKQRVEGLQAEVLV